MLITPVEFQVEINPNDPWEIVKDLLEKAKNCTLLAEKYFRDEVDEDYVLDFWDETGINIPETLDIIESNIEYRRYGN